jgi:magnesium-transporting ATPase (P-type)
LWLGLLETALCYAGFFAVYHISDLLKWLPLNWQPWAAQLSASSAPMPTLATTVFFAGVIMAQVGNAFACRTEKDRGRSLGWFNNRFLLISLALELLLMIGLIYWPPLTSLFGLASLPPLYWIGLGLYAPTLYGFDRLRKSWARRLSVAREKRTARLKTGDLVL